MSLLFDDSQRLTSEAFASPLLGPEQQPSKAGKTKLLRLDSLTTIQACNELGILVDDLKPK